MARISDCWSGRGAPPCRPSKTSPELPRNAVSAITTPGCASTSVDIGSGEEALDRFAVQMADEVKQSGVARVLEPMSSADRKIVHDALSEVEGITTRSEGDDPYRRVVITPDNA